MKKTKTNEAAFLEPPKDSAVSGLIVITSDVPGAGELRDVLLALKHPAEIRGYREAILFGDPAAVVMALYNRELPADRRAADLRRIGFKGVLLVLGRNSPDLAIRRRLAEQQAWFLPALSGPVDVASRLRQLLG